MKTHAPVSLVAIGSLAVATAALHLVFGLYYATRAEHLPARVSLQQQGETFLASYPGWNSSHESDSTYYNRTAVSILQTGLPRRQSGEITLHAPLYSYFLAACYAVGGIRLLSVAIPQALLSGLTAFAVGLAALRIGPQNRWWTGLFAALLYLVNLRIGMYVGYIYPTLLALALFAAAFCLSTHAWSPGRLTAFSLAIILGTFAQANFFLLATACVFWLALQRKWPATLVIAAGITLKLGSGLLTPQLPAQNESAILWEANNPYYESMRWMSLWERRPGNPWTTWSASPAEQRRYDDYLQRAAAEQTNPGWLWIKENPGHYAKLCFIRLRTTLGPFTGQMSLRNRAISTFYWLLIFPLGYYGWWKTRHLPVSQMALCVFLVLTAFETLVISDWYLRYRLPVDLMLTAYAAVGFALLWPTRSAPSPQPPPN